MPKKKSNSNAHEITDRCSAQIRTPWREDDGECKRRAVVVYHGAPYCALHDPTNSPERDRKSQLSARDLATIEMETRAETRARAQEAIEIAHAEGVRQRREALMDQRYGAFQTCPHCGGWHRIAPGAAMCGICRARERFRARDAEQDRAESDARYSYLSRLGAAYGQRPSRRNTLMVALGLNAAPETQPPKPADPGKPMNQETTGKRFFLADEDDTPKPSKQKGSKARPKNRS